MRDRDEFEIVFDGRKDGPGGGLLCVPMEARRVVATQEPSAVETRQHGTGRQRALAAFRAAGQTGLTTAELSEKIGIDYKYTHRLQAELLPMLELGTPVRSPASRKMLRRLRLRADYRQRGRGAQFT